LGQAIKARISSGEFPVGSRLLSVRDLMSAYAVSYATVTRTLRDLAQEGYLTSHVGKGTFVRSANANTRGGGEKTTQTLGFLLCNASSQNMLYLRLLKEMGEQAWKQQLAMNFVAVETEPRPAMLEKVQRLAQDSIGVVMTGVFDTGHVREVTRLGKPVVLLGWPTDHGVLPPGADMATTNSYDIADMALRRLRDAGRTRIAIVLSRDSHHYRMMEAGYRQLTRGLWSQVFTQVVTIQDGADCAKRMLAQTERPDALIVESDRVFVGMWQALREAGLRMPQDMMAVVNGHPPLLHEELYPPVDRIDNHWPLIQQEALELIQRRVRQPEAPPRTVLMQPTWVLADETRELTAQSLAE
jgi:DNA-binding LacI/PurR family transcriptional regulator